MTQRKALAAAKAHAKINLHLGVGELREDGYHDLATVFQSLDGADVVEIFSADDHVAGGGSPVRRLEVIQRVPGDVPTDNSNLAWRAVDLVASAYQSRYGQRESEAIDLKITKTIPVAGGMAGGSADAAAALVAANAWLAGVYEVDSLGDKELRLLGAQLGADVPFALYGGTALGVGRGDELVRMLARGHYTWAVITSRKGLKTPDVFRQLDQLRAEGEALRPNLDTDELAAALGTGDPRKLGQVLHNDLQPAAFSLKPELRKIITVGVREGAYAGIVSGSGPTCVLLCEDRELAQDVIHGVTADVEGTSGTIMTSPACGAELIKG